MVIFACKEPEWESRVVLTPDSAAKLVKLGLQVQVEAGIGASLSASFVPEGLEATYGHRVNTGFGVFVTLRPAAMK